MRPGRRRNRRLPAVIAIGPGAIATACRLERSPGPRGPLIAFPCSARTVPRPPGSPHGPNPGASGRHHLPQCGGRHPPGRSRMWSSSQGPALPDGRASARLLPFRAGPGSAGRPAHPHALGRSPCGSSAGSAGAWPSACSQAPSAPRPTACSSAGGHDRDGRLPADPRDGRLQADPGHGPAPRGRAASGRPTARRGRWRQA